MLLAFIHLTNNCCKRSFLFLCIECPYMLDKYMFLLVEIQIIYNFPASIIRPNYLIINVFHICANIIFFSNRYKALKIYESFA